MFDGDKWSDKLSKILDSKIGKAYILVSKAKGADKSISKIHEINGKSYIFNEYGDRDETLVKEITL